jgi:hypothetical protein
VLPHDRRAPRLGILAAVDLEPHRRNVLFALSKCFSCAALPQWP